MHERGTRMEEGKDIKGTTPGAAQAPKLVKVYRFDAMELSPAYFTKEGYLMDRPILTTTGIFEYHNDDGSIRRELRLPGEVFDPESLASYKGKPIVITHDAGKIDKDNVDQTEIGTILSDGYRDGNNVRAEIVIHDTDAMKASGLKELSLGYTQTLVMQPGEYNGEHYDAIQTNIRVNHLALVGAARAGDTARLNIDSKDAPEVGRPAGSKTQGGKRKMDERLNLDASAMTAQELLGAIGKLVEQFTGENGGAQQPGGDPEGQPQAAPTPAPAAPATGPKVPKDDADDTPAPKRPIGIPAEGDTDPETPETAPTAPASKAPVPAKPATPRDILNGVKKNQDGYGDPADLNEANTQIQSKNADIDKLVACLETIIAKLGGKNVQATDDCGGDTIPTNDAEGDETDEGGKAKGKDKEGEGGGDIDWSPEALGFNYEDDPTEDPGADDDEKKSDTEDGEDETGNGDNLSGNKSEATNTDSADPVAIAERVFEEKLKVARVGDKLNLDGLDTMPLIDSKKAVIRKVIPTMNLDGVSPEYVDAAYSIVLGMIGAKKDAGYQRRQMRSRDTGIVRSDSADEGASSSRQRMIARMDNHESGNN